MPITTSNGIRYPRPISVAARTFKKPCTARSQACPRLGLSTASGLWAAAAPGSCDPSKPSAHALPRRGLRAPEPLRDLVVSEPVDHVEPQRVALILGQRSERLDHR